MLPAHCWRQVIFAARYLAPSHLRTWLSVTFLGLDGTFPSLKVWDLSVTHDPKYRPEL